jgi:hypothetical protein
MCAIGSCLIVFWSMWCTLVFEYVWVKNILVICSSKVALTFW